MEEKEANEYFEGRVIGTNGLDIEVRVSLNFSMLCTFLQHVCLLISQAYLIVVISLVLRRNFFF